MSLERTLSIIKPDATRRNLTGEINSRFEKAGLRVIAQKRVQLSRKQAQKFYEIHKGLPFYDPLCDYMSSGPIVAQILEGKGAISVNRKIMGATNPANAEEGTIRKDFAESKMENSVHGSDCKESSIKEIAFFFNNLEVQS